MLKLPIATRYVSDEPPQMKPPKPEEGGLIAHFHLDLSTLLGLELPQECVAGIEASAELLRLHARKVEAFVFSTNAPADNAHADKVEPS